MATNMTFKFVENLKIPSRYTDALVKGLYLWIKGNLKKYSIFFDILIMESNITSAWAPTPRCQLHPNWAHGNSNIPQIALCDFLMRFVKNLGLQRLLY